MSHATERATRRYPKAARVYARTFLEHATAAGVGDAVRDELAAVLETFAKVPGLARALSLTALAEDKRARILAPLADKASEPVRRLLKLLEQKGRLALLPDVAALYLRMEEAARKVRRARVRSAVALDAAQLDALAAGLAARSPGTTYLLENETDASLIAGFRIEEDGYVTDASLRHKLDQARRNLTGAPMAKVA